MKNLILIGLAAAFMLYSCASNPPPAVKPAQATAPEPVQTSTIQAQQAGFSPNNSNPDAKIGFGVHFAYPDQVVSWSVAWNDPAGKTVKKISGTAGNLPPSVLWDGKSDPGLVLTDGTYQAVLTVDYGKVRTAQTAQAPFILDVTPPSGTIALSPDPLVTDGTTPLQVILAPKDGGGKVVSWRLSFLNAQGTLLRDFINEGHTDNQVVWDGRDDKGSLLFGTGTYSVKLQLLDEYGNHAEIVKTFQVTAKTAAAPVTVQASSPVARPVINLYFKAYSTELADAPEAAVTANQKALAEAAGWLKAHPDQKILIIGHANQVNWQDKTQGDAEQTFVLIPLSQKRAQAVKDLLKAQGLAVDKAELQGVGDENPQAPFGDAENNWKNRRAEIRN